MWERPGGLPDLGVGGRKERLKFQGIFPEESYILFKSWFLYQRLGSVSARRPVARQSHCIPTTGYNYVALAW